MQNWRWNWAAIRVKVRKGVRAWFTHRVGSTGYLERGRTHTASRRTAVPLLWPTADRPSRSCAAPSLCSLFAVRCSLAAQRGFSGRVKGMINGCGIFWTLQTWSRLASLLVIGALCKSKASSYLFASDVAISGPSQANVWEKSLAPIQKLSTLTLRRRLRLPKRSKEDTLASS